MRTILHIGSDKAGSTALQFAFADKREELARRGVSYPDLDGRPDHLVIATSGSVNLVVDERIETVVLSSEALWPVGSAKIRSILGQLPAGPVDVVGYVREPGGFTEAAFLQRCRMCKSERELLALAKLLAIPPRFNPIARRAIRRFGQLTEWKENRGRARLIVRPYLPRTWPHGDIVADFCGAVGLEELLGVFSQRSAVGQNPTLDFDTIHASVLVREQYGLEMQTEFLRYCASERRPVSRSSVISEALRSYVRGKARNVLAQLGEEFGDLKQLDSEIGHCGPTVGPDRERARSRFAGLWPAFEASRRPS